MKGSDLECPYCNAELKVCHDDSSGYEEDVQHHMECSECEKAFVFTTSVIFYYHPEKADCLNSGEHQWKDQICYPRCFAKMFCKTCGEIRMPTDEEKKKYNIPERELKKGV